MREGGHTLHQLRVVDGDLGGDSPVHNGHLHLPAGVGDDAESGDLRGGAGGGVHRHQGHWGAAGLVNALVVVDGPAVGGHHADALGAVVGGAAAQREDGVAAVLLKHRYASGNILIGGVWLGPGEYDGVHTGLCQDLLDLSRHAALMEELVGDDHRLMAAQALH